MQRKTIYFIMLTGVFVCLLVLYFFANPFHSKEQKHTDNQILGNFSYEAVAEYEDLTDEYDPSLEAGSELADNNTFITNYELLYDFLTMQAAGSVTYYAAEFLNEHGYGGYHELTIIENTINNDETYPRFICILDDSDKYIEVRYRTDSQEFEFSLIDRIF